MKTQKCRVLCVDDHEDTCLMLTYLLGQSDYEVVTAYSFQEALSLAGSEHFDLYVLDKRLPDGTGHDLCRRLNEISPDTPVIFYTGDAYELHRREGLRAGAQEYVVKPNIGELVEAVHRLLSEKECGAAVG